LALGFRLIGQEAIVRTSSMRYRYRRLTGDGRVIGLAVEYGPGRLGNSYLREYVYEARSNWDIDPNLSLDTLTLDDYPKVVRREYRWMNARARFLAGIPEER
jgi:hypothetical protein